MFVIHGPDFDGWAYNKELVTVESTSILILFSHKRPGTLFQLLKNKPGLQTLVLSSASRTDKGVSACAQVRLLTWPKAYSARLTGHFLYLARLICKGHNG